jgi:hypothetical protein
MRFELVTRYRAALLDGLDFDALVAGMGDAGKPV